jgi:hypothetical protein
MHATTAQLTHQALKDLYGRWLPNTPFTLIQLAGTGQAVGVCDCHGCYWALEDLIERENTGLLECTLVDDYTADTSR